MKVKEGDLIAYGVLSIVAILAFIGLLMPLNTTSNITGASTTNTLEEKTVKNSGGSEVEKKRVIINPLTKKDKQKITTSLGVTPRYNFKIQNEQVFTAKVPEKLVNNVKRYAEVEEVKTYELTKNNRISRNEQPNDQTPWGIEKIYNNDLIRNTSGGENVNVAVLDTGVNTQHPDLKNNIEECKDYTSTSATNKCSDKNGHGTHVSGTILANAGEDNKGIYGVAPKASLLAYKVCNRYGVCWADDIAKAIIKSSKKADIISLSLGANVQSRLIKNAVKQASKRNVIVVAAAGNDGPSLNTINYPAHNKNALAIAATKPDDSIPYFSSRGTNDKDNNCKEKAEICYSAPGVGIESTWKNNDYASLSGTSMATPHITGFIAKTISNNKADYNNNGKTTITEIRKYLRKNSKDITKGRYANTGEDPASGLGLPSTK